MQEALVVTDLNVELQFSTDDFEDLESVENVEIVYILFRDTVSPIEPLLIENLVLEGCYKPKEKICHDESPDLLDTFDAEIIALSRYLSSLFWTRRLVLLN